MRTTSTEFLASVSFFPKMELKSFEEIKLAFWDKMNETATGTIDCDVIRILVKSSRVPNLNIFAMNM